MYWTLEDGTLTISGTGAMYNFSYPDYAPWYSSHSSIKTVDIKQGVTSIGDWAFYWCSSLTSVTIPSSVTSIGYYAFYGCDSLTDVYYSGSEAQWNALKANIGLKNDPLLNATIHVNSSASYDGVMVVEKLENDGKVSLGYSFNTEKTGTGTVCAIQYVNGQMVGMKMIEVDLSAASGKTEFSDADGAVYKIILLDSAASPCCAAWQS